MTREQFIELVKAEQEALRRFLLTLCCGNADEADDLAQESLVKAYLSSADYKDKGKFHSWLYKIAYNTFISSRRQASQTTSLDELTDRPDTSLSPDRKYKYQELYAALAEDNRILNEPSPLLLFRAVKREDILQMPKGNKILKVLEKRRLIR